MILLVSSSYRLTIISLDKAGIPFRTGPTQNRPGVFGASTGGHSDYRFEVDVDPGDSASYHNLLQALSGLSVSLYHNDHAYPLGQIHPTLGFLPTTEEIRAQLATLEGQLYVLSGKGLEIYRGPDKIRDIPPGGALLDVSWAVSDQSYQEWYPTTEAAKAALLALARKEGCTPSDNGLYVDLTSPGCQPSSAWVTRRQGTTTKFSGETAHDAIINHFGLDIEEEEAFDNWLLAHAVPKDANVGELERQYHLWKDGYKRHEL